MFSLWKTLRYLPPSVQTAIKRCTSPNLRIWLRQKFGADPSTIPDRVATISDGRRFHIGPDWIYWAIHLGLEFEPEVTSAVRELVFPGDTVVDIGANFGWYSTLFAQAAGPEGRVLAFEPVPSTYDRLTENLVLNGVAEHVTAMRSAVGNRAGEVDVYVFDALSHSCASLSPGAESKYETVKAPIVELDKFLADRGIGQVDFLKCDVEGSELAVLGGAAHLLNSPTAPIVLIEQNSDACLAFGYSQDEIWRRLQRAGYDHFYQLRSKRRVRRITNQRALGKLHMLLAAKGDQVERRLLNRDVPPADSAPHDRYVAA